MSVEKKKNGSWKKKTLTVICIILALLLALLIGVTLWVEGLLGSIGGLSNETMSPEQLESYLNATDPDGDFTGPELSEEDIEMETAPVLEEQLFLLTKLYVSGQMRIRSIKPNGMLV